MKEDKSKYNKFRVTKKPKESAPMFEVDAAGYRAQMAEMKPIKTVYEIIANANGMTTYKMHNGHRGINHPVINLITGKGEISSQNHGFAISREETESNPNVEITHVHLNDNTIAGIKIKNNNCFSVQYHPEASPGPHDSSYLFDQFIEMINNNK